MFQKYRQQWLMVVVVIVILFALFLAGCNRSPPLESYGRPQQDAPQWRIAKEPPTKLPRRCHTKNEELRGEFCVSTYRVTGQMEINLAKAPPRCVDGYPRESMEYPGGKYVPKVCTK